jgi:protein phosphatase
MTMALSHGKHLIVSHVGDSRASLLHKGKLKRLTRDHTLVAQLLHEGALASDDPLVVGFKGALLQAVGGADNELRPDVDYYELTEGDQLLLCTDGLTDMVDDCLIESVLSNSASAELACNTLVKLALANGGLDNITVIVARYSMPEAIRS